MHGTLRRPSYGRLYTSVVRLPQVRHGQTITPVPTKQHVTRLPPMKMSIEDMSYYVGKSIVLFTMFYCSMNWVYYRGLRKDMERDDEDQKKK